MKVHMYMNLLHGWHDVAFGRCGAWLTKRGWGQIQQPDLLFTEDPATVTCKRCLRCMKADEGKAA